MRYPSGPQLLAGTALLGIFWYFTKRPESDVIEEGQELVIGPPGQPPVETVQISVEALQKTLVERGFSVGSSGVDGDYGPATVAAWKAYAQSKGLPGEISKIARNIARVAKATAESLTAYAPSPAFLQYRTASSRDASTIAVVSPAASSGTPGILRVDAALEVAWGVTGLAMGKIKTDVLAPTKLKNLLAYVAKTCTTLPKMTGPAVGGVSEGGPGVIITVRIPVLFTKQPDAPMRACVEAALKQSNSEVRSRLKSLTLKAEQA